MSDRTGVLRCRSVRGRLVAFIDQNSDQERTAAGMSSAEREAIETHLQGCRRCVRRYRMGELERTVLYWAGAPEPVSPGDEFFAALRVRLARGPVETLQEAGSAEESWATVLVMARQLIPAMAILLLLMLGATFLFDRQSTGVSSDISSVRPTERILFSDVYDLSNPTRDDVLETLVAIEEKEDGR
jgi:hypothetical protein